MTVMNKGRFGARNPRTTGGIDSEVAIQYISLKCKCRVRRCFHAYNEEKTVAEPCQNCSRCCPKHGNAFRWAAQRTIKIRAPTTTTRSQRATVTRRAKSLGIEKLSKISSPDDEEDSVEPRSRKKTHDYVDVFMSVGEALGHGVEMKDHLRKSELRKFRRPKPDAMFEELDRKYVGSLNIGITMIIMWIAEQLLPSDSLRLVAEFKISSPSLRQSELSIVEPARRYCRELKRLINSLRYHSVERLALETIAGKMGGEMFSSMIDVDQEDIMQLTTTDNPETVPSVYEYTDTKKVLFSNQVIGGTKKPRRHKHRLSTANKNFKVLANGLSLGKLQRFRHRTSHLEDAVDFILACSKHRGFSTARIKLSNGNGNYQIPWLYRTMPRLSLWDGYLELNNDPDDRLKQATFLELVDHLTRGEVPQRTGIDYIAQEYGMDTFSKAEYLIRSLFRDKNLNESADLVVESLSCADDKVEDLITQPSLMETFLAELRQCKAFTMRWMRTHISTNSHGDGYFQHSTNYALTDAALATSSVDSSTIADVKELCLRADGDAAPAIPTKHCVECTRFVCMLHSLETYMDTSLSDAVSSAATTNQSPYLESGDDDKPRIPENSMKENLHVKTKMHRELLADLRKAHMTYQAHLVKGIHAEANCNTARENALRTGAIYVVADWKMKWIPTNWDETAKKWFGKRGIIWHGFAVTIPEKVWSSSPVITSIIEDEVALGHIDEAKLQSNGDVLLYFHDVFKNDHKVDASTTLTSIEALIVQLQRWFPNCQSLVLQTDNGPCYKGNMFIQGLLNLNSLHKLKVRAFINTGVQDGKTHLDGHFGVLTQNLIRQMVLFKDMNSPDTLVRALAALAPKYCIVRMIECNHGVFKALKESTAVNNYAVPSVSELRHVDLDNRVGFRHAGMHDTKVEIPAAKSWDDVLPFVGAHGEGSLMGGSSSIHLDLKHAIITTLQDRSRRVAVARNFKKASFEASFCHGSRGSLDHALQYAAKGLLSGKYFALKKRIVVNELDHTTQQPELEKIYHLGWALAAPSGVAFAPEHKHICRVMFLDDMRSDGRTQSNFATCFEEIVRQIKLGIVPGPEPSHSKIQDYLTKLLNAKNSFISSLGEKKFDILLNSEDLIALSELAAEENVLVGSYRLKTPDLFREAILSKKELAAVPDDGSVVVVGKILVADLRVVAKDHLHLPSSAWKDQKAQVIRKAIVRAVYEMMEGIIALSNLRLEERREISVTALPPEDDTNELVMLHDCPVVQLHRVVVQLQSRVDSSNPARIPSMQPKARTRNKKQFSAEVIVDSDGCEIEMAEIETCVPDSPPLTTAEKGTLNIVKHSDIDLIGATVKSRKRRFDAAVSVVNSSEKPPKSKSKTEKEPVVKIHESLKLESNDGVEHWKKLARRAVLMPERRAQLDNFDHSRGKFNDFETTDENDVDGNLVIIRWTAIFSLHRHVVCAAFGDGFIYAATITGIDEEDQLCLQFFDGDSLTTSPERVGKFWDFGDILYAKWTTKRKNPKTKAEVLISSDWLEARVVSVDDVENGFLVVRYSVDGWVHKLHISDVRDEVH